VTAKRTNLNTCSCCQRVLSTVPEQGGILRFCGSECAHEWSAMRIETAMPNDCYAVLHQVRPYLEACATDRGASVQLGLLWQLARKVWPDLPRSGIDIMGCAAEDKLTIP
jgi:hypothetical protein